MFSTSHIWEDPALSHPSLEVTRGNENITARVLCISHLSSHLAALQSILREDWMRGWVHFCKMQGLEVHPKLPLQEC